MAQYTLLFAATYGSSTYNLGEYNSATSTSTGAGGSAAAGGSSALANTGIAVAAIVALAATVLLVAMVVRVWKRKRSVSPLAESAE